MKHIVENSSRLPLHSKLRLLSLSLKENGVAWTCAICAYYLTSPLAQHSRIARRLSDKSFAAAADLRRRGGLPGLNSVAANKIIWEHWDWGARGEEWTPSAQWKARIVETLLAPNILENSDVLEIGPGAGRWTPDLLARAKRYIGVDISKSCLEACRIRFSQTGAEFMKGNGADLEGIASQSIDAIWSFDVFVHINGPEFQSYAHECARVLRPGGIGVIQHGGVGGVAGGWRSDVRADDAREFFEQAGCTVLSQMSGLPISDGDGPAAENRVGLQVGLYDDVVTIFAKPNTDGATEFAPAPQDAP